MTDSPARERAELARLRLACYLSLARVPGQTRVVKRGANGYSLTVLLDRLTVAHVSAVPKVIDNVPVEVLV